MDVCLGGTRDQGRRSAHLPIIVRERGMREHDDMGRQRDEQAKGHGPEGATVLSQRD